MIFATPPERECTVSKLSDLCCCEFWSILGYLIENVRPFVAVGDPNLQKGGPAEIILLKLQG